MRSIFCHEGKDFNSVLLKALPKIQSPTPCASCKHPKPSQQYGPPSILHTSPNFAQVEGVVVVVVVAVKKITELTFKAKPFLYKSPS